MRRRVSVVGILVSLSVAAAEPPPASLERLPTYARIPSILGQPKAGFVELYEFDMWLSEQGRSEAHVRRCGAPPYEATSHDGHALFDVLPGNYAILLHQPEWFVRPAVVADVRVRPGENVPRNIMPPLDYCCVSGTKLGPWEKPGLPQPWATAKIFHQTFVAKGTSITHAHYKLAGHKATSMRVSIHEVREGIPPANWPRVGPERIDPELGQLNDNWVGWRSGELPTVPGRKYALRLEGLAKTGGEDTSITILVHHDAVGPGYLAGTAYADGKQQKYDLYASISSDSDGTVVPYMRIYDIKPGELAGAGTWSQSWVAQGRSLAAVDLLVAWGEKERGVLAEMRVHEGDSPKGRVIGVTKRATTAWWGPGHGFLGAAWQPGEVELQPGKAYCLEFVTCPPCKGYNVSAINHPANAYPNGQAFRDGQPVADKDLEMTVVEYVEAAKPRVPKEPYRPEGRDLLINGDFEQGTASQENAQDPPGWKRWSTSPTAFWYGKYGRDGSNASRVIGGNINGTKIDGGFVQQVVGLKRGKSYCLSGWTASSAMSDKRYLSAVGYDPTGQTDDPKASTIVWGLTGRRSHLYDQVVFPGIKPQGNTISVWTRGHNKEIGDLIFTVDFDDVSLVEEETQ
ncbi:MAG: hypothetical protein QUV05_14585 [Phycisphaerae bacterium]|nr:hypothetical protein [Phycisphaerae bacterium]